MLTLLAENPQYPWTVNELAAQVKITRRHLERLFQQELQTTPRQFLLTRRLEKACELLVTTFHLVKEIAADVGMPDVNHFNRQFKKAYGLPPDAYRRQAASKVISTDVAFE